MTSLPSYDELPLASKGGRSGWGMFGPNDRVGLMNLITPEVSARAARLVSTGEVFPLDVPLDFYDPPLFDRTPFVLNIGVFRNGTALDETYDGFNPQAASQWDSLAHVAYAPDQFYNGATLDQVLNEGRNTIAHWAQRGIVTRGVLLDLKRVSDVAGEPYDAGSAHAFTVAELERAREASGITFEPGDIVVLRTGFTAWYAAQTEETRRHVSVSANLRACGIEHTEEMARYVWNTHAAAFATDCPALEVWPMNYSDEAAPFGRLHQVVIGQFGLGLGELWNLDALADRCAATGRYEFLVTSAPVNSRAGVGSSANALAIL